MTEPAAAPRRFEIGERYRPAEVTPAGTTVVTVARPWGWDDQFATVVPCCRINARVAARNATATPTQRSENLGASYTCRSCGWKWYVHLALNGKRLVTLPDGTGHPHVHANQAEWVSRGHGTRPYRRVAR